MSKNNILIHFDWFDYFEESELTEDEEMQIIFAAIKYAKDGVNPTFSDRALKVVWLNIKSRVDYDIEAYERKCRTNQKNGQRGGRPKKEQTEKTEGLFWVSEKNPEKPYMDILSMDIRNMDIRNMDSVCVTESASPEAIADIHTPTREEVRDFCSAEGLAAMDPERFWNYYESQHWLIDGRPMDWHARAKLWDSQDGEKKKPKQTEFNNFQQRKTDWSALEKELIAK